jgi:rhodanese-related sulfurtransferase
VQKEFGDLPGVAVEDVKAMLDAGQPVQIIDARPQSYIARQQDIMDGAVWRDPERINDWIGDLSKSDPVVVFCAYGFHVRCKTASALREAGFDAKYMKGGHSAWKAIGGPGEAAHVGGGNPMAGLGEGSRRGRPSGRRCGCRRRGGTSTVSRHARGDGRPPTSTG